MALVAVNLTFSVLPASATESGFDAIADNLWDVEHANENLHDSGVDADLGSSQLSVAMTASAADFLSAAKLAQEAILAAVKQAGFALNEAGVQLDENAESLPQLTLVSQTAELVEAMQIA